MYTIYLDFTDPSVSLHKKSCPFSTQPMDRNARRDGWWKDFDSLEAAISEMKAAAKFCGIANFGPCKHCTPF
jgi:hypothetical protein